MRQSFVITAFSVPGISCIYDIVRKYGSDSSWVRKGVGPIRLGSENVWVRVVQEILGPSRLGSELSDIQLKDGHAPSSVRRRPSSSVHNVKDLLL